MEILHFEDVSFTYPEYENKTVTALRHINLSVKMGEFVVVMGESGCGKTTLLKLVKKELSPAGKLSGNISYFGTSISKLDNITSVSDIGYVMQKPETQIVTDKVYHELAFALESLGMDNKKIRLKVGEMASFFGIESLFRKSTENLSGGEKQMINLASVMVLSPKILLLDEPTSQLDPIAAGEFMNTLKKINEEMGTTIILVEHRLEEAFKLADKVVLMEDGKISECGTPKEIGKKLGSNKLLAGAPASVRLYNALLAQGDCPISVKEGKNFLLNLIEKQEIKKNNKAYKCIRDKEAKPILQAKEVFYRYEKNDADVLKGININIYEGEIYSLLGGNGTGKSTLLSILSAINHPYRGSVLYRGKNIYKINKGELYKNNIGFLPQDPLTVFVKSTIREDYEEILKLQGITENVDIIIEETAKKLGILHLLARHPYDLSGGEGQKCALGKVLLKKPSVLLLDEPTKGIDGFGKESLKTLLQEVAKNTTIFMVTHDVEFAAVVSNRCGLIFDGDIVAEGEPYEFFCENSFYTTAANRISQCILENILTVTDIVNHIQKEKKSE